MNSCYWKEEINNLPKRTISIRGNKNLPRSEYDKYLLGFLTEYKSIIISFNKTQIYYPSKGNAEYYTLIYLNSVPFMKDIHYEGPKHLETPKTNTCILL